MMPNGPDHSSGLFDAEPGASTCGPGEPRCPVLEESAGLWYRFPPVPKLSLRPVSLPVLLSIMLIDWGERKIVRKGVTPMAQLVAIAFTMATLVAIFVAFPSTDP